MTALGLLHPASALAWKSTIEGGNYDREDSVSALQVTENGNLIVAGALDVTGGRALVAEFANGTGSVLWRSEIQNETGARYNAILDLELAADGSLVVAGPLGGFPVRKLSSISDELWRATIPVDIWGGGIELDQYGDVVVHGWDGTGARYPIRDLVVAKLEGATGVAHWMHLAQEVGSSSAIQAALDSRGDVIVAGNIHDETVTCPSFAILKLSGLDGSERWRRVIPSPVGCGGSAQLVAVDASDDVIAAGSVMRTDGGLNLFAAKVDGDAGFELWRYHVQSVPNAGGGDAHGFMVTADGDALISGRVRPDASIGDSLRVVRLRGSDGSAVWTRDLRGIHQTADNGQAYPAESLITVGLGGEIFVGDSLTNLDNEHDLAVVRLDGQTGEEDWRFIWDGRGGWGGETARGVAVDSSGDLLVIGYTNSLAYGRGFSVFNLDRDTGSPWPCADGYDQDGDELADYPSDPECASLEDPSEDADCSDGIDNDGDGSIDFGFNASNDPGCAAPLPWALESPTCSNGLDDDLDGSIDHPEDGGCGFPWSPSETRTRRACGLLGLELMALLVPVALRRLRVREPRTSPESSLRAWRV